MSANTASEPSTSSSNLTPQGQGTRSSPRLREKHVLFEVLDNPSLREEILKHAIIGSNKKVDLRTACTLRLVQKSWDQSVLGILWKLHEPLYEVHPRTERNLDASIKTFAASSRIPPPPLQLGPFSFQWDRKKIRQFSTFVTKCGPALFQMEIEINEFGILPCSIVAAPWSSLSRLHKLKICLPFGSETGQEELTEKEALIQSIFLGATALAELDLSFLDYSFGASPPDVTFLESLTFPPTLIKIKLDISLEGKHATALLTTLVSSPLPKVTSFSLSTCKAIFPNDQLLFSILDKWKTSLKTLAIEGYFQGARFLYPIRFPVMKELEEFSVSHITAVLQVAGPDSLERCLPKLRTLRLRHQSLGLLRKWTESAVFSGVTHLELLLAENDGRRRFEDETDEHLVSVNADAMQLVNAAFPSLRKLGLGISSSDPSGLKYVFMEMRQLEELELHVFGNLYDPSGDEEETDPWDPILTGLSDEMLASSEGRGDPDCLEENGENLVSITNLQELKRLSVKDCRSFSIRYNGRYGTVKSLISVAVFEHAYLKMPKLSHLFFDGPFTVSVEMRVKWDSDQRRSLICWQMD